MMVQPGSIRWNRKLLMIIVEASGVNRRTLQKQVVELSHGLGIDLPRWPK